MCVNDPLLLISKSQGLLDHPFFMFNDTDIISDPCFPEGYQLSVSGPLSQQFAQFSGCFLWKLTGNSSIYSHISVGHKVLGERAAGSLGSR